MIVDLPRFLKNEQSAWQDLQMLLDRLETEPDAALSLDEARRLHTLYQRAASGLARLSTSPSERGIRDYLEPLVARAYGEIHGRDAVRRVPFRPWHWFFRSFPRAFRRHWLAFALAFAVTMVGAGFGALAVALDPQAKSAIMPFSHLLGEPGERVANEENQSETSDMRTTFAAQLMTHNTRVSILAMALGMTYGVGTWILLFYNGVILGAVCLDYIAAGESVFLSAWLLPHGSVEIPAIFIAGQAGFVLAGALIGRGSRSTLSDRMRAVVPDTATLIGGVAIILVWAGIIESFLSQDHEPVLPYGVKIAFGLVQITLLILFLAFAGRRKAKWEKEAAL